MRTQRPEWVQPPAAHPSLTPPVWGCMEHCAGRRRKEEHRKNVCGLLLPRLFAQLPRRQSQQKGQKQASNWKQQGPSSDALGQAA